MRSLILAALLVAVAAGCGGSATSPSASDEGFSGLETFDQTGENDLASFEDALPSEEPLASTDESSSGDPDLDPETTELHDAPELEALLPSAIGSMALRKESSMGSTFLADDGYGEAVSALLTSAGKSPDDLREAHATDVQSAVDFFVGVYRLAGVSPQQLQTATENGWKADHPGMATQATTEGGKPVRIGSDPTEGTVFHWYVHGTDLYEIQTPDPTLAAQTLAALP
ncbi:MAG: hypothetical protein ACJ761_04105 [Chloroflexota bacterium]